MSTDAKPLTRTDAILGEVLNRLETSGQIVPGAKEELAHRLAGVRTGPDDTLATLFELLDGSPRYKAPGYQSPVSALQRVLDAMPLTPRGRKALADKLAMQANTAADPEGVVESRRQAAETLRQPFDERKARFEAQAGSSGRVARLVMEHMDRDPRTTREFWDETVRPDLPYDVRRARDAFKEFRHYLHRDVSLEDLGYQHRGTLGHMEPHVARRKAYEMLKNPWAAKSLTDDGEPIPDFDAWDPAFQPTDQEIEDRKRTTEDLRRAMGDLYTAL